MENNFIQMAASIVCSCISSVTCVVTLIFDGTPQIIVQWVQFAAPRWPNVISSATDNEIFKNRAQNIECSLGCVAYSAVLLKSNVANILLFNFCEQRFVQHGPITIAIDCTGLSLLIFEEKWPNSVSRSKIRTKQWPVLYASAFQCAGFLCPKCDNFPCLHTRQDQNKPYLKRWLFSAVSRSQAHLAKRKCIGWSIGFNSWTNWTLYGIIKVFMQNLSQWCLRNV